ncbi:hypothetical protein ABB37_02995 [Leptomonas pyrrhocoris]|uniref:Uncharacterized protein n=1 Tax=Leptomonas pyrrhocoris TaxID=157538 RepID=A0A0N0DXY3_LEPPY|nr:hypothetical protein ABB37_02995 [Leptomonas pyrrhocoris]KPA83342.1 hypothetical protein ABB37_02995 [Leptomonas pyrrhocoris]|eukprot:XP_015661781.1 hypothetical protein ABB37_02995 [Leptomonas pyrrhocoris]
MSSYFAKAGCGWRHRRPIFAVSLFLISTVLFSVAVAEVTETPLCSEKHGFAGEFNDHFSIPVETAPAAGEAIILIARAFPAVLGGMFEHWVYLNATFNLPEGPLVSRMSDNNGLLELTSVAAGTDIEVRVIRVRPGGPVPFRFFSFFANRPLCHIAVSPTNNFIAPVPHRLAGTTTAVTMYFKTTLPRDQNAATISIISDGHVDQPYKVADKNGVLQEHSPNDIIQPSTGDSISFSFSPTPNDLGNSYCFTEVTVAYANVQGGTVAPATTAQPGGGGAPNVPGPPGGVVPATTAAPSSAPMSLLRRCVLIALACFVMWQAAQAVYNYHVLGKRDVMEIVPCAETIAAGARGVQLAASRGLGMSHRRADGYDCVHGMDDPYA